MATPIGIIPNDKEEEEEEEVSKIDRKHLIVLHLLIDSRRMCFKLEKAMKHGILMYAVKINGHMHIG